MSVVHIKENHSNSILPNNNKGEDPLKSSAGKDCSGTRVISVGDECVEIETNFSAENIPEDSKDETYTSANQNQGTYFKDGVRRIDFVLVYSEGEHEKKITINNLLSPEDVAHIENRRKFFLENLSERGIDTETEKVEHKGETLVFVKVHATFKELCHEAERLNIEMPLKLHDEPVRQRHHQIAEVWSKFFNCYYCSKTAREPPRLDSTLIYYPFDNQDLDLFDIKDGKRFFSDIKRTEMTWEIMQSVRNDPEDDKKRGIEGLIEAEVFETAYPIHESFMNEEAKTATAAPGTLRQHLKNKWASWRQLISLQPIHQIRNYFGEKIGFYYVFMDFYLKQLLFPTIAGWIVFIYGMTTAWRDEEVEHICDEHGTPGSFWMCPICVPPYCEPWKMHEEGCHKYKWGFALDNEATVALSCVVMLWAILFLKFWKRRESSVASDWKTMNVHYHQSAIRPEYEEMATTTHKNPITLKIEPHVPVSKRICHTFLSIVATFFILATAGAALAALVVSRIALYAGLKHAGGALAKYNVEFSRWFIHFLIFVLVTITEKIYSVLVLKLTSFECPRTHHEFMQSLLWKLFVFGLVNECVPIFYAAFLKGKTVDTPIDLHKMSELCDGGCMGEVVELVFVLLTLRLLVGNALELGLPFLKNCIKRKQAKQDDKHNEPQWLQDFYLNEVELDGVYEDYMEMMIQFAFVVLFIPAFPLAPFFCLINNIIEIRLDGIKMLIAHRRPLPIRVPGIQIWNKFLDIIIKIGILVNAAMIAFTSDVVPRFYYQYYVTGVSGGQKHSGFTAFSLSFVNVSDWGHDEEMLEEFHHHHIDRCYYSGYREPISPMYPHKASYWRITTIRLATFALYSLVFFILMWLINSIISDVPGRISTTKARQNYSAKKHLNEQRRKMTKANKNHPLESRKYK